MIAWGSGSGKTNELLDLINNQPDIDQIYLHAKDPYKGKYNLLINKREITVLKVFQLLKSFYWILNDMDDIYRNIEEYNQNKKTWKILIVFDNIIANMLSNQKLNPVVAELSTRGRKLNISLAFTTQPYFAVPKNIRLNSTQQTKVPKRTLTNIEQILHQILTFKTLWIFIKSVLQNHIPFWLLILILHQIIFMFQTESFRENIKTNHEIDG